MISIFKLILILLASVGFTLNAFSQVKFEKINWNELNSIQKTLLIQDLKLFLKSYDHKTSHLKSDKQYSYSQPLISIIQSAYARDNYNCLYGGWPSTRNKDNKCIWPSIGNDKYKSYQSKCSSNQLLCNPNLFGESLCVPFRTLEQRTSAFSQCEKRFTKEGRNLDQIVNSISAEEFGELKKTIDDVCNTPQVGTQHITPMCRNLKNKLAKYIPNTYPSGLSYTSSNKLNLVQKESALEKMIDDFQRGILDFNNNCPDPNPSDNFIEFESHKDIECKNKYSRLLSIEKNITALSGEIEVIIDNKQALCEAYPEFTKVYESIQINEGATEQIQCTAAEKAKYKKDCFKDIMCFAASSLTPPLTIILEATNIDTGGCLSNENNCAVQAITALVDTLWSTITGVWDLLKMAKDASIAWVKDTWNSFWNDTKEVENKSSNAAHQVANLTDKDVADIKEDKDGWLARAFKGLWSSIKDWLAKDIYCQDWQGMPRMPGSKCLKPFSFDCMSCNSLMKGSCALIGAVASEVGMAFFTGGAGNAVKHSVSGASKILRASRTLSKAVDKASALIKYPAKLASKSGKWLQRSTLVRNATGKTANFLSEKAKKLQAALARMKELPSIQKFNSFAGKAYKYSGVKAFVKANNKAFKAGQKIVDKRLSKASNLTTKSTQATINTSSISRNTLSQSKLEGLSVLDDIGNNTSKLKALDKFSSEVHITDRIALLMDEAHNAPYGITKNKKILELQNELIEQGFSKKRAKELILGLDDGSGVLKGGLASDDVKILGQNNIISPKEDIAKLRTEFADKADIQTLQIVDIDKQAQYLVDNIGGLSMKDAKTILAQINAKQTKTSATFGGSRIRGNYTSNSDLDIGYGHLNTNQTGKFNRAIDKATDIKIERDIKIAVGNKTKNIDEIRSPEEFFMRSGKRSTDDKKHLIEPYYIPSGSITIYPDGTIIKITPR